MNESTGVLAGSEEGQTETLSTREYRLLKNCLTLERRNNDSEAQAIADGLCAFSHPDYQERLGTLGAFLYNALQSLGDHVEEIKGLVIAEGERPILLDENSDGESRIKCVTALLKLLERGDWFANYLDTVLPHWSLKPPVTPHEVIRTLVEQTENFESDVRAAKRMLAEHPMLFEESTQTRTAKA